MSLFQFINCNWFRSKIAELSHERDIDRSIEINHVVPRAAFVDHVISQSSYSALANYEA